MNSREKIIAALNHQEPDMIPFDLAGSTWTGISATAYRRLLEFLGKDPEEPAWADVIQQIVIPSWEMLDFLGADTRGLFPLTSHNWDVWSKLSDKGANWEYFDEWGFTHQFPKTGGLWFSLIKNPMSNSDPSVDTILNFRWPAASDKERIKGLAGKAVRYRDQGKIVLLKGLCAGIFEMQQRFRGMTNALVDPFLFPDFSDMLIGRIADLKIEFWKMALTELGNAVDIIAEADDYGTQESQLIDPEHFRKYYKPHVSRIIRTMKQYAPGARVMFHSCGNVRPIIPDFIEMGIEILNPVHVSAAGMEPRQLKKDFGKDIVFWGGGVDTQKILSQGTVAEVEEDVRRNIDALAPGGGFVFSAVHNIQADVPPGNILAMVKTLREFK